MQQSLHQHSRVEFRAESLSVIDVGDMVAYKNYCREEERTTIFAIGGFIGEIILVLATIDDFY